MSDLPPVPLVLDRPAAYDQVVEETFIDQNGHMNIGDYFRLGTWAPWHRLVELGMDETYIPTRGFSFFTVEHHVRYLSELRLGQHFSVHGLLLERTAKTLHGAGVVVDREQDRIACVLEIVYVHIAMAERRAAAFPDDVAGMLDGEIAACAELAPYVDRLALRR